MNSQRPVSPTPTLVDEDPSTDDINSQLNSLNIKVKDFAFLQPHHRATPPKPVEIFNPNDALAEYDYRLNQIPRLLAVASKDLARLIEIGWIPDTPLERSKWSEEERNGLIAYRNRPEGMFPYRCIGIQNKGKGKDKDKGVDGKQVFDKPSTMERIELMKERMDKFETLDRMKRKADAILRREEKEREEIEKFAGVLHTSAIIRATNPGADGAFVATPPHSPTTYTPSSPPNSRKRASPFAENAPERSSQHATPPSSKRARRSNSRSPTRQHPSAASMQPSQPSQSSPPPMMRRQYPALLASYNPTLYPDAINYCQSQSQPSQASSSQITRQDTPPLDADSTNATASTSASPPRSSSTTGNGVPLVHPRQRALRKTLSRSQTFTVI